MQSRPISTSLALRTHFNGMLCKIRSFFPKKIQLKMSTQYQPYFINMSWYSIHCTHHALTNHLQLGRFTPSIVLWKLISFCVDYISISNICTGQMRSLSCLITTTRGLFQYNALPISRGQLSPNNSRKTSIARPLGRGMDFFRKFEIWPKSYLRSCCVGWNIVL